MEMNIFFKTVLPFVLACGATVFLACGDDTSGVRPADGEEAPGKIDSSEIYNAFTDKRDGNVYRVVLIGSQAWMAEDLRYTDNKADSLLARHSWCSDSRCLYDFAAVTGDILCLGSTCDYDFPLRGICPEGWHVPNSYEWDELIDTANEMDVSLDAFSPFATFPTGEYDAYYFGVETDNCARYWTSSQENALSAREYYRCGSSGYVQSQVYSKSFGYAVRCVADSKPKFDTYVKFVKPDSIPVVDFYSSSYASSSSSRVPESSSAVSSSSMEPYVKDTTYGEITDERDGNVYGVARIGSLLWMTENLRYADSAATPALKGNMACIENDNGIRCQLGVLYTYSAAVGDSACAKTTCFESYDAVQGICPEGWRLPTRNDWKMLLDVVDVAPEALADLKFVPTGERRDDGVVRSDMYARFWLANENGKVSAYEGYNSVGTDYLQEQTYQKNYGYAVRCVKDVEILDN